MATLTIRQRWTIKPGTTVTLYVDSDEDPTSADLVRWVGQLVKLIEDRAVMSRLSAKFRGEEWSKGVADARAALADAIPPTPPRTVTPAPRPAPEPRGNPSIVGRKSRKAS